MNQYKSQTEYSTENPTPGSNYVKENYNVCGTGYYVHSEGWRMNNLDDGSDGWGCHICPSPFPTAGDVGYTSLPTPYPAHSDLQEMCSGDINTWFQKQQSNDIMNNVDATLTGELSTWTNVRNVLQTGEGNTNHLGIAAKWWTEKLTDSELNLRKDRIQYSGTLEQMKQDIINYTYPSPPCPTINSTDNTSLGNLLALSTPLPNYSVPSCNGGAISDIITDQFEPWSIHYAQNNITRQSETVTDDFDFSLFNQQLGPPNQEFENCMNHIFTDNNITDQEQINQLKVTNWRNYTDENIMFIRRKLQMFLDRSNDKRIMECMGNYLYLDDTICRAGLTQHMVKIAEIIFFIIGYDPSFTINDDSDRRRLEELISRIGKFVPRVLDRIIEISDMYEKQYCRGQTSHVTHVLREMYDQSFNDSNPTIQLGNPFSSLMSEDQTSPTEFNRATILSVLGIAFLKYF